ncbi:MAG TPA: Gldg family protein [Polyangiaceae bacterium]|nr:Gldg family protein [Polyangiaceae bacterium]
MAMTSDAGRPAAPSAPVPRAAPAWLVPLYVAGLVFVYLGERVLASWDGRTAITVIGGVAVLGATVLRFAPRFRAGGERRGIENLLAILSVVGLLALGVYALTTDWGLGVLGVSPANPETRETVHGVLTVIWIALILVSVVPMIFAETASYPMRHAPMPEGRRVRMAAANGLTLALAAVYGSLFVYAAADLGSTADFSYFKTSKPSQSTRRIAESLSEPVSVIAFFPEVNEAKTEVQRYLSELSSGLTTLKIEVKDHLRVPKLARELNVTQDGAIVLKRGDTSETLVIGTDMKDARPKLKTLDQDFQEKLLKMARSRRIAYLTAGHGELNESRTGAEESGRSTRLVRQLLQKQNYLIKELGIGQGLGKDVPDDAEVVLVLGPSEPFAPEEIQSLQRYADRGGHLLLALDPDALSDKDLASEDVVNAAGEGAAAGGPSAKPASAKLGGALADAGAPRKLAGGADAGARPGSPHGALAARGDAGAAPPEPGLSRLSHLDGNGNGKGRVEATLDALADIVGLTRVPGVLANDFDHLRRRFNESDHTLLLTNSFSSHASVSTLSRNSSRAAIVSFGGGALEAKQGMPGKVDFTIRSRSSTFPDTNGNFKNEPEESRTTYNMAAAVTMPRKTGAAAKPPDPAPKDKGKKPKDGGPKPVPEEMRAFVVGDADVFSDVVFANVVANQVLFVDAIRWLGGEESFAGEQTTEEDRAIEHTKEKDQLWFYSTIFGAPALVMGLGVLYSRRSRRKRPRGGRS